MKSAQPDPTDNGKIHIVQLTGKQKGDVLHFPPACVTLGRSSDCDVILPPEAKTVSRKHASVYLKNGVCYLKNHSPNGCFVNGELREHSALKPGDVISLSSVGPKISVIYQAPRQQSSLEEPPGIAVQAHHAGRLSGLYGNYIRPEQDECAAEFTIYCSRTLTSYYQASVSIGRSEVCDFRINHPGVMDRHVLVYYEQDHYFLHNYTDLRLTRVNDITVQEDMVLKANDRISLHKHGPVIIYKGDGVFQEELSTA